MKKLISIAAALLLCTAAFLPTAQAQGTVDITGTWTFFVTINGAPPCQCIQIARLRADGTLDGAGNDRFSGTVFGTWKRTGANDARFAFVQNNINEDGSAGGEYVIRGSMSVNADGDSATGTSTFQLIDNNGKVQVSGTATFRATKLKLE